MVQLSHAAALRDIQKRRESDETLVPTALPSIPQVRMTRRIAGEYTLHDAECHTFFADSVGMVSDWRKRGPVYEVPFSTLCFTNQSVLTQRGAASGLTPTQQNPFYNIGSWSIP